MGILDAITGGNKKSYIASPTPERLMKNEKVLILTANDTEDLEFFYPYYRLNEAGYMVDVATPNGGPFEAKNGMGLDETMNIASARAEDYALLYIPGGKAPATLRENKDVLAFVHRFAATGRPIAAICHGAQLLISAGLAKGKQMAAAPDVRSELERAGGIFINEALVEDGQFITGRKPGDLPRHLYGVLDVLQGTANGRRTAA